MLKKIIKCIILSQLFFIGTVLAKPQDLPTFALVQEALSNGYKLNFIVNISKCKKEKDFIANNHFSGEMIGSFRPQAIINITNQNITTSSLHFTLNNPRYKNVPIYEYIKYDLASSGTLLLTLTLLAADNKTILSEPSHFECVLGSDFKIVRD